MFMGGGGFADYENADRINTCKGWVILFLGSTM